MTDFVIYGATGYTGKLVARFARDKGLKPLLSGRNAEKLRAVAEPLGLPWTAVDLADAPALDKLLAGKRCVLHIAGPFSATSAPMRAACLRGKVHYLDITGEIDVFEACAAEDAAARAAGVMLLPGVGFDVVPSDCLAAHVARRLPGATELTLAIAGLGGVSRGTAKTGVEGIAKGTRVRRGGRIVALQTPPRLTLDAGQGERKFVAVSWGDVATAFHSTGIPDITVYFESRPELEQMVSMPAPLRWLFGTGLGQSLLKAAVDRRPEGPTDAQRAAGHSILIAEAKDGKGGRVRTRLRTPEGYTLTAETGLAIVRKVLEGQAPPGFQTPSRAYGADFILGFDGVSREDLNA